MYKYLIKKYYFQLIVSISIVIASLLTYNFTVTFDSYLYLNSAEHIFSKNFILEYQWLREPGYPLILKLIAIFYQTDFIYVIIQSAMLSISFFLYYNIFFGNVALSKLSKFLIIFIVLNPYYITWASTVLQVAPITLCLAMITYMINKNYEYIASKDIIYWIAINLFCLSIAFNIGAISIICNLIVFIKHSISRKILLKEIAIVSSIFLITALAWLSYKEKVLSETKGIQSGWNTDYFSSANQLLLPIELNSLTKVLEHSTILTGLSNLGNRESESSGYVNLIYGASETCAIWYPTEFTYVATKIQESIQTTCSSRVINQIFSRFNFTGGILWQISSALVWLSFVWVFMYFKKKEAYIIIPSFLLLASYSTLIFTIDRYILPIYLVGLFMFIRMLDYIIKRIELIFKMKYW
jgi:hypothetical protein